MDGDNAVRTLALNEHAEAWFPGRRAALPHDGLLPFPLLPRRMFTWVMPREAEMQPLHGVGCITVHHSGFPEPFLTTDLKETADYLENIRQFHTGSGPGQRGWADIGYHFAVDLAGRVWQLRSMNYQGAHVKNHNADNLGIVALGNFDLQKPTHLQLTTLHQFLDWLVIIYALQRGSVVAHATLADQPTNCPGRLLQVALAQWPISQ